MQAIIFLLFLVPSLSALNDDNDDLFVTKFQEQYHRNFTTATHPEMENPYEEAKTDVGWEQWVPSNMTFVILISTLLFLGNVIILLLCCIYNLYQTLKMEQEDFSVEMQPPIIQLTQSDLHHLNVV